MKKNFTGDTEQGKREIAQAILLKALDNPDFAEKPFYCDSDAVEKYCKCLDIVDGFAKEGKLEYESDEASRLLSDHCITIHFLPDVTGLFGTEFKGKDLAIMFGLMDDAVIDLQNGNVMLSIQLYKKGAR